MDEVQRLLDEARKSFNYQVTDFSAELLSSKFKLEAEDEGDIFVPEYQRKLVWTEDRQSYFIESLLLRVPIPPLFLYDVKGRLEIIDGSQRLRTVRRFMADEFVLDGLEKLDFLNGYRFSDLPAATQLRFKNAPLQTFVLTEDTDGVTRFDTFRRLNTSSKRLTDAQIRVGHFPDRSWTWSEPQRGDTTSLVSVPSAEMLIHPASDKSWLCASSPTRFQ